MACKLSVVCVVKPAYHDADILAEMLARMSARMSVSASWNAGLTGQLRACCRRSLIDWSAY